MLAEEWESMGIVLSLDNYPYGERSKECKYFQEINSRFLKAVTGLQEAKYVYRLSDFWLFCSKTLKL